MPGDASGAEVLTFVVIPALFAALHIHSSSIPSAAWKDATRLCYKPMIVIFPELSLTSKGSPCRLHLHVPQRHQ